MSKWWSVCGVGLMLLLAVSTAPARQGRPAPRDTRAEPRNEQFAPVRAAITAEVARLDAELADLALSRAGTPEPRRPGLEFRIDLRVLARWAFAAALDSPDGSDAQASFYLRGRLLLRAAAYADTQSDRPGTAALKQFHSATFKFKQPGSVQDADNQSRDAAVAMLSLLNPSGFDAKPMRPPFRPTPPPPGRAGGGGGGAGSGWEQAHDTATVAELSNRVRGLAISGDLRRQLLALAESARAASDSNAVTDRAEAAALHAALQTAVGVAEGLASNLAVSPADREKLERDLASAVALTTDPRLRPQAEARLRAIQPYARLLARVASMKLSEEQMRVFAPVIAFSRTSSDGPAALTAVEDYLKVCAEFDTRFGPTATPTWAPPQKASAEQSIRQFGVHRAQLESAAARVSALSDLTTPLGEMRHHLEVLGLLEKLPRSADALSSVPTRPQWMLARRITQAAALASAAEASPERLAARTVLSDFVALAAAQEAARSPLPAEIPDRVIERFGVPTDRLDAKRKALIAEQLQLIASNTPPDREKMARLARLPELQRTLTTAARIMELLSAIDTTGRWVDLSLGQQSLNRLVNPMAAQLRGSFEAFLEDSSEAFDRFPQTHAQMERLLQFFQSLATGSNNLPVPPPPDPDDPLLLVQLLLTPFANAPYATERFLSLTLPHDIPPAEILKRIP